VCVCVYTLGFCYISKPVSSRAFLSIISTFKHVELQSYFIFQLNITLSIAIASSVHPASLLCASTLSSFTENMMQDQENVCNQVCGRQRLVVVGTASIFNINKFCVSVR